MNKYFSGFISICIYLSLFSISPVFANSALLEKVTEWDGALNATSSNVRSYRMPFLGSNNEFYFFHIDQQRSSLSDDTFKLYWTNLNTPAAVNEITGIFGYPLHYASLGNTHVFSDFNGKIYVLDSISKTVISINGLTAEINGTEPIIAFDNSYYVMGKLGGIAGLYKIELQTGEPLTTLVYQHLPITFQTSQQFFINSNGGVYFRNADAELLRILPNSNNVDVVHDKVIDAVAYKGKIFFIKRPLLGTSNSLSELWSVGPGSLAELEETLVSGGTNTGVARIWATQDRLYFTRSVIGFDVYSTTLTEGMHASGELAAIDMGLRANLARTTNNSIVFARENETQGCDLLRFSGSGPTTLSLSNIFSGPDCRFAGVQIAADNSFYNYNKWLSDFSSTPIELVTPEGNVPRYYLGLRDNVAYFIAEDPVTGLNQIYRHIEPNVTMSTNVGDQCGVDVSSAYNNYGGYHNNSFYPHQDVFIGINVNGELVGWGRPEVGGIPPLGGEFVSVTPASQAFAALKSDGSIVAWGRSDYGGSGEPTDTGYVSIASGFRSFAALKNDGSISSWGIQTGAPTDSGYISITTTESAFAALHSSGKISAWGRPNSGVIDGSEGGPTGTNFTAVFAASRAFAGLTIDGKIVAWGDPVLGGEGAPSDSSYEYIASTQGAFAALKSDGSISSWGAFSDGAPNDAGYVSIATNQGAFAALKSDGSITAWGSESGGGTGAPVDNGYIRIYATSHAFAAIKSDGSITSWGAEAVGGGVSLGTGYTKVFSNRSAFAALTEDGSIVTWGRSDHGGEGGPVGNNYVSVSSTLFAFTALKADGVAETWGFFTYGNTSAPTVGGLESVNGVGINTPEDCGLNFGVTPPGQSGVDVIYKGRTDLSSDFGDELFARDSGNLELISKTTNGYIDGTPAISPNGVDVVFGSTADGEWDLYRSTMTNLDSATNITNTGPEIDEGLPVFSPIGDRILYKKKFVSGNTSRLSIIDLDGNELFTDESMINYDHAAWHPNGKQLVASGVNNVSGLFLSDLSAGNGFQPIIERSKPNDSHYDDYPIFDNTGRFILYASDRCNGEDDVLGMYVLDLAEGVDSQVACRSDTDYRYFSLSSDGQLVFTTSPNTPQEDQTSRSVLITAALDFENLDDVRNKVAAAKVVTAEKYNDHPVVPQLYDPDLQFYDLDRRPTAIPQSVEVDENSIVTIDLEGSDPFDRVLEFSLSQQPEHGELTGELPNIFYSPNLDYIGSDSFSFLVDNGEQSSEEANVDIFVNAVVSPPIEQTLDFTGQFPSSQYKSKLVLKKRDLFTALNLLQEVVSEEIISELSGSSFNQCYGGALEFARVQAAKDQVAQVVKILTDAVFSASIGAYNYGSFLDKLLVQSTAALIYDPVLAGEIAFESSLDRLTEFSLAYILPEVVNLQFTNELIAGEFSSKVTEKTFNKLLKKDLKETHYWNYEGEVTRNNAKYLKTQYFDLDVVSGNMRAYYNQSTHYLSAVISADCGNDKQFLLVRFEIEKNRSTIRVANEPEIIDLFNY